MSGIRPCFSSLPNNPFALSLITTNRFNFFFLQTIPSFPSPSSALLRDNEEGKTIEHSPTFDENHHHQNDAAFLQQEPPSPTLITTTTATTTTTTSAPVDDEQTKRRSRKQNNNNNKTPTQDYPRPSSSFRDSGASSLQSGDAGSPLLLTQFGEFTLYS